MCWCLATFSLDRQNINRTGGCRGLLGCCHQVSVVFRNQIQFHQVDRSQTFCSLLLQVRVDEPHCQLLAKRKTVLLSPERGILPLLSVTKVCTLTLVVSIIYEKKETDHRRDLGLVQYFPVPNRESILSVPVLVKSYNLKISGFCCSSFVTPSMGVLVVRLQYLLLQCSLTHL